MVEKIVEGVFQILNENLSKLKFRAFYSLDDVAYIFLRRDKVV
jgi:hypothetical protein